MVVTVAGCGFLYLVLRTDEREAGEHHVHMEPNNGATQCKMTKASRQRSNRVGVAEVQRHRLRERSETGSAQRETCVHASRDGDCETGGMQQALGGAGSESKPKAGCI